MVFLFLFKNVGGIDEELCFVNVIIEVVLVLEVFGFVIVVVWEDFD